MESVYSFICLGATVNPGTVIKEEIKERIAAVNRAYV
jgi:hypothetical protein